MAKLALLFISVFCIFSIALASRIPRDIEETYDPDALVKQLQENCVKELQRVNITVITETGVEFMKPDDITRDCATRAFIAKMKNTKQ